MNRIFQRSMLNKSVMRDNKTNPLVMSLIENNFTIYYSNTSESLNAVISITNTVRTLST